jgi:hypothetical protein
MPDPKPYLGMAGLAAAYLYLTAPTSYKPPLDEEEDKPTSTKPIPTATQTTGLLDENGNPIDTSSINLPDDGTIPEGYTPTSSGVARIDFDGTGTHPEGDTYQPHTAYKVNGQSLNGDNTRYVVANKGSGYKLGDTVYIYDQTTGKSTSAIVGDIGPANVGKVEISRATANALGVQINGNSNSDHRLVILSKTQ